MQTYLDPAQPGSFGGVDSLFRAVRGEVSKKKIRKWLEGVDAYTLHKPVRRKFPTNRVIVNSIDQQWQADLVDLSALHTHNDGYRYLLTCIDVLSKYAWTVPMKTKRGEEMVNVFRTLFLHRKPRSLQTDQGTEFKNAKFQNFLKMNNVRFFTTFNNTKASVVERYNRTIKSKMWKYFTANHTYRYLDVLNKLVHAYNNSFHRSIKMSPISVTSDNEREVWYNLYKSLKSTKTKACLFSPGNIVRVSKHKLTFEKGYETNWSEELFVITECVSRDPPVYRIKDLLDEPVLGTFYAQELQKVKPKSEFPVERVISKRSRKGHLEYLVKYKGYPQKFNQWLPASNLFSL